MICMAGNVEQPEPEEDDKEVFRQGCEIEMPKPWSKLYISEDVINSDPP